MYKNKCVRMLAICVMYGYLYDTESQMCGPHTVKLIPDCWKSV